MHPSWISVQSTAPKEERDEPRQGSLRPSAPDASRTYPKPDFGSRLAAADESVAAAAKRSRDRHAHGRAQDLLPRTRTAIRQLPPVHELLVQGGERCQASARLHRNPEADRENGPGGGNLQAVPAREPRVFIAQVRFPRRIQHPPGLEDRLPRA